jgi:sec-independent protein translocase protein TatA
MFRNIGWPEILLVLAIILVVFGAARLPTMAHSLGKALTSFKKGLRETADDVKDSIREDVAADTESADTSDPKKDSTATCHIEQSESEQEPSGPDGSR